MSAATGRFRAVDYRLFSGHRLYYRGRYEIPLNADYFNRIDREEGLDVSSAVRLDGLLENLRMKSPDATLFADGGEQLVYLFDLTRESRVESVELEALLANDYRVDVTLLATSNALNVLSHSAEVSWQCPRSQQSSQSAVRYWGRHRSVHLQRRRRSRPARPRDNSWRSVRSWPSCWGESFR